MVLPTTFRLQRWKPWLRKSTAGAWVRTGRTGWTTATCSRMRLGLVFMEALARMAAVDTPALSSSITLLETVYGRDFRGANFLVRALGLADTDASALRMRCAAASSAATVSRRTPAAR